MKKLFVKILMLVILSVSAGTLLVWAGGDHLSPVYQNINDDASVKQYLLIRIANDQTKMQPLAGSVYVNDASAWQPEMDDPTMSHPVGLYIHSPNNAALNAAFSTIANRIKLRILE